MSGEPIEDEYVYHITNQIAEYFRSLGFEVIPIPISRIKEKEEGYDWRYELRELNKVFMLQFKRPNPRSKNLSWELDSDQHELIRNKNHVFYCFPKSKDREDMPVMLYYSLFKRATFDYVSTVTPTMLRYCDGWGSFAKKVLQCIYGKKIIEEYEVYEIFEKLDNKLEKQVLVGITFEPKKIKLFADEGIIKKLDKNSK